MGARPLSQYKTLCFAYPIPIMALCVCVSHKSSSRFLQLSDQLYPLTPTHIKSEQTKIRYRINLKVRIARFSDVSLGY